MSNVRPPGDPRPDWGAPLSAAGPSGPYPPPPGWGPTPGPPTTGTLYYHQPSGLMLPQGTELASVGRRIGAFFLAIPLSIMTLFIGYLIWSLIVWGKGQTPALQVLGMRCYRPESGRVAGWWWMALREVIGRLADDFLSIITLFVSFILFASRSDHRSLHDLVAGTVVLHDPGKVLSR